MKCHLIVAHDSIVSFVELELEAELRGGGEQAREGEQFFIIFFNPLVPGL